MSARHFQNFLFSMVGATLREHDELAEKKSPESLLSLRRKRKFHARLELAKKPTAQTVFLGLAQIWALEGTRPTAFPQLAKEESLENAEIHPAQI